MNEHIADFAPIQICGLLLHLISDLLPCPPRRPQIDSKLITLDIKKGFAGHRFHHLDHRLSSWREYAALARACIAYNAILEPDLLVYLSTMEA